MDIENLRLAKTAFEKEGVRFVKEVENNDVGPIIDSYVGPGRQVWIAISTRDKTYDSDKRELIKQILRETAEGRL